MVGRSLTVMEIKKKCDQLQQFWQMQYFQDSHTMLQIAEEKLSFTHF